MDLTLQLPQLDVQALLMALAIGVTAVVAGLALHWLAFRIASIAARRSRLRLDDRIVNALRAPSRLLVPLLVLSFALPAMTLPAAAVELLRHAISVGVIIGITWLGARLVDGWAVFITRRHDIASADDIEARRVHTQVMVLERTLIIVIVVLGAAAVLMTFPRIREIGASLLVSAGMAGIAVGLAARPVLENIIAGLQLAFTQPIRVNDVVIVEGEWGKIEEITATYVVVAIWDQRRLVVPFSHFISKPFQNWTRESSDILGTVFIHADYTVPVEAVREELTRICEATDLWDGRLCNLQVTGATDHTLELRALVSAADSAIAWELRVHVREQLIDFLKRNYPHCLPRARMNLVGEPDKVVAARFG